jgi:hypothetical protein
MQRSFRSAVVACALVGVAVGSVARVAQSPSAAPLLTLAPGVPTELSPLELRDYARAGGHDLFWLGPMVGTRLEVTATVGKGTFVRYVPAGGTLGDPAKPYTTVATYAVESAYRTAKRSGRQAGAVTEKLPSGTLAVWRRERPTNVFVARPGSSMLIEIFAPNAADARRLARSSALELVG